MKRMIGSGVAITLVAGWVLAQSVPASAPPAAAQPTPPATMVAAEATSSGRFWVVRLNPGADLRGELAALVKRNGLRAAAIVTAVGSLDGAALRFADMKETALISGKLEIVALTGTLGADGVHLHLAASDGTGRTIGGHLQNGSMVRTTAEIVLVELTDVAFERQPDAQTGFRELSIHLLQ